MSEADKKTPAEQILDMWDKDSEMDSTEAGKELLKIPKLHAKYLRHLNRFSSAVRSLELDIVAMRKRKYDYYGGRMDREELEKYGLEPFKLILKTELKDYVDSDPDVLTLMRRKSANEEVVTLCNSILKELQSRTYQLRGYIDYEKLVMGQ
jgi:hypothetical protein